MATYDFLGMCKNVAQDAGLSGDISSVAANTGDLARVVRYVREACLAIESRWGDWKFNYKTGYSTMLGAGLSTYSAPEDLHRWNKDRMYINGNKVPKHTVLEYHEFRGWPTQTAGTPAAVVIMPDNALLFYPAPDSDSTFTADYYKKPAILTENTDLPNVPQQYCPVIQAYALLSYAQYDASEELIVKAQGDISTWDALLENDQRPGGTSSDLAYGADLRIHY